MPYWEGLKQRLPTFLRRGLSSFLPRSMTFYGASIGRVVCRVQALREVAAIKWQQPLPFSVLVSVTSLPLLSLQRLMHDSAKLYDVHTIARLCWFFNAKPSELLVYTTTEHIPSATSAMVRRETLPTRQDATNWRLQLNLSNVITDHWQELRSLGAAPATLSNWKTHKNGLKRVHRQTLAYLCTVGVAIDDIFIKS